MDVDAFPDRTHVSLWMREYEAYLFASPDREGIVGCSDPDGALHAAWALHRVVRGGADYLLFHSASYGRYLAVTGTEDEEFACRPVQCTYDSPEQNNVLFQAVRAEDGSDDIHLRHYTYDVWCRPDDEHTALPGPWPIHWVVEAIPPRQFPPELPHPIPVNPLPEVRFSGRVCIGRRGGPFAEVEPQPVLRRRINYMRADDQGNFNPHQWRVLEQFEGQSVFNLRIQLAAALGEANNHGLGITLCVSGGSIGRWTPLVIDLPPDEKAMDIVVLTTGSPAAQELVYPDVDAP